MALAWAFVASMIASVPAFAQTPATVSIDNVRVSGRGAHRVAVSVLDAQGTPLSGLESAFDVALGGRPVQNLKVRPARAVFGAATLTLVIDAALLEPPALAHMEDAVRELGRARPEGDRIRVIAAGSGRRAREAAAGDAEQLASALGGLASDGTPRLYDALHDAARGASRLPAGRAGAIVVITRGADGGSDRSPLEVLALSRSARRLTRVMVMRLGDAGASPEAERLRRLAASTGGALTGITSPASVAASLPPLASRALDDWVLEFDASQWSRDAERQQLDVAVEAGGARRAASLNYATVEALLSPWWKSPLAWLVPLVALLFGAAAWALTRRRQRGLLVHDHDGDDGVWYELFGFPVTLGGAAGNDLVFQHPQVSRNHATLERRGNVVELVDLNSENGTFVNGDRITRRALADGDRLSFGKSVHLIYEARG
jgi:hypothetical protein